MSGAVQDGGAAAHAAGGLPRAWFGWNGLVVPPSQSQNAFDVHIAGSGTNTTLDHRIAANDTDLTALDEG